MDIVSFKRRFDPLLKGLLRSKIAGVSSAVNDPFISEILGYAQKLLMAGGKRVRPYVAYLAYRAGGGRKDRQALEVFAGLEFFHAFALIHDDIMDRGLTRHGLPTTQRFVLRRLKRFRRLGDHEHLAEAQAILLGDLLFNWACEQIEGTRCAATFHRMANEVIAGQMLDIDSQARQTVSDGLIAKKMSLKTASYTFVHPLNVGFALAGASRFSSFAESFGLPLGLAFQIQDDLLDLTAPSCEIGKTTFSDLEEGQHTVFTQFIRKRGSSDERKRLESLIRSHLTPADRPRVQKLFAESGALAYGRDAMERCFEQAVSALSEGVFSRRNAKSLRELITFIRARRV